MTYDLSITAILIKGEHDPDTFGKTEHLFVGLRAVPELLKSAKTSQDLPCLVFRYVPSSDFREIERAYD